MTAGIRNCWKYKSYIGKKSQSAPYKRVRNIMAEPPKLIEKLPSSTGSFAVDYITACELMNIPPHPSLTKELARLMPESAQKKGKPPVSVDSMKHLVLRRVPLTVFDSQALFLALRGCESVVSVSLVDLGIMADADICELMAKTLSVCNHTERLSIRFDGPCDASNLTILLTALPKMPSLKHLDLSDNVFDSPCHRSIQEAIAANPHVIGLSLAHTRLGNDPNAVTTLAETLQRCMLHSVDLSCNPIDGYSLVEIVNALGTVPLSDEEVALFKAHQEHDQQTSRPTSRAKSRQKSPRPRSRKRTPSTHAKAPLTPEETEKTAQGIDPALITEDGHGALQKPLNRTIEHLNISETSIESNVPALRAIERVILQNATILRVVCQRYPDQLVLRGVDEPIQTEEEQEEAIAIIGGSDDELDVSSEVSSESMPDDEAIEPEESTAETEEEEDAGDDEPAEEEDAATVPGTTLPPSELFAQPGRVPPTTGVQQCLDRIDAMLEQRRVQRAGSGGSRRPSLAV